MNKEELVIMTEKLAALGEDAQELQYWVDVFDDLSDDAKEQLSANLKKELEALSE